MRALLILTALAMASPAAAVEPEVLRARAALALAMAAPKPNYAESYKQAVAEAKPLVVFVKQPVRELPGCICVGVEAFPDLKDSAVIVGVPGADGLRRVDLPGTPTAAAIRAAASPKLTLPANRCDGTTNCRTP